jgi:hypothetical protein
MWEVGARRCPKVRLEGTLTNGPSAWRPIERFIESTKPFIVWGEEEGAHTVPYGRFQMFDYFHKEVPEVVVDVIVIWLPNEHVLWTRNNEN